MIELRNLLAKATHMAHEGKAWKKSWYDLTIHAPIEKNYSK
jgi:hypothetical protein